MDRRALLKSYQETYSLADRFRQAIRDQILNLLEHAQLHVAVPIESRTKGWSSIVHKVDRLPMLLTEVKEVKDLWDLIGLRCIFPFSSEAARACSLIEQNFHVQYRKDVGDVRNPKEFGYQSVHFVVSLLQDWLTVPSLREFESFRAEIQIRTLSQHTWAVASRLLQYNQEAAVPVSVQRSLHRVAALMELVDLELERVSEERSAYRKELVSNDGLDKHLDKQLNVDLLIEVIDKRLPESYRIHDDDYGGLLHDLGKCNITTARQVIELIRKHLANALTNDAAAVQAVQSGDLSYSGDQDRIIKGIFYTHVGLVQNMLNTEFGTSWRRDTT